MSNGHSDKKSKKYSPVVDISANNHKKRSFDGLVNDSYPSKRQKPADSNYSQNPMCFHCKQSKKTLEEYKKSMESKLSDTNKRMEDVTYYTSELEKCFLKMCLVSENGRESETQSRPIST